MSHLEGGTLHALLDGEIPSGELPPVLAHLESCADCRAALDEARGLAGEALALVESLGDGAPADRVSAAVPPRLVPGRTGWYRQLAWAATVVMAAGLGYAVRGPGGAPRPPAPAAEQPVPGAETTGSPPVSPIQSAAPQGLRPPPEAPRSVPPVTVADPTPRDTAPPAMNLAAELNTRPDVEAPQAKAQALSEPAPRRAAPALSLGRAESRLVERAAGIAAAPAVELAADRLDVGFAPIGFPEAVARLGGTLRLVDGMIPDRLEASTTTVRVIYPLLAGELVLEQRRVGDSVSIVLRGPLSADSLAVLRRRVRE